MYASIKKLIDQINSYTNFYKTNRKFNLKNQLGQKLNPLNFKKFSINIQQRSEISSPRARTEMEQIGT